MWNDRFSNPCARGAVFEPITATTMALTAAGAAMSAMGTIAGGNAAAAAGDAGLAAGQSQKAAEEFKAKQEDMAAVESRASAQRNALESRRQAGLVLSKLQAGAAADGGSATDSTVTSLAGQIAGRGEYDSLLDMYKGENRARGLEDQATGSRLTGDALLAEGVAKQAEGKAKKSASLLSAAGTLIGGAGSAYKSYNKIPTLGYG